MRATGVQPKKAVTVLAELLQHQCSRLQPLAENQTGVQLKKAVTPRLENHPVKMIPSVKVVPTHLTDGVSQVSPSRWRGCGTVGQCSQLCHSAWGRAHINLVVCKG